MARASRIDFDALKARADFRTVLDHYGLAIVGRGDQAKIRCPFHDDDERPSCSVNLGKGLFHCFGAGCDARGNVLDFVHRMEARDGAAVTIREAGLRLATICGIEIGGGKAPTMRQKARGATRGAKTAKESSRRANAVPEASGEPREGAGGEDRPGHGGRRNRPLGFRLTLDPGHPYLAARGVPPAMVELFGLGFCGKGVMAGRIAIPIHDAEGGLVAYAGRWAGGDEALPEGEERYKLPAGFRKALELFNLHRVRACRHLVVVEGYFGAIRLHGLRLPAVALMGGSASEEQVVLLRAHCPALRHVTVMLDGDEAGRKATEAVAPRLAGHWWTRVVALPEGTQPDTVAEGQLAALLGRAGR